MSGWRIFLAGWLTVSLAPGCSRPAPVPREEEEVAAPEKAKKTRDPKGRRAARNPPKKHVTLKPKPPENPVLTATREAGIIRGQVRWEKESEPPAGRPAAGNLTVLVNDKKVRARPSSLMQVNSKREIANVVIWLEKPPGERRGVSPPVTPLVLRQEDGDFRPPVVVARKGATLQLVTADDRANFQATGALTFNVPLARSDRAEQVLSRAGLVSLRSQLLPWASAYLWVFDHRYFARTGPDGKFRLPKLPPGDHRLVFWHEGWRRDSGKGLAPPLRRTVKVTVGKGEGRSVDLTLSEEDADRDRP
jgi:hypothetical protein